MDDLIRITVRAASAWMRTFRAAQVWRTLLMMIRKVPMMIEKVYSHTYHTVPQPPPIRSTIIEGPLISQFLVLLSSAEDPGVKNDSQ